MKADSGAGRRQTVGDTRIENTGALPRHPRVASADGNNPSTRKMIELIRQEIAGYPDPDRRP